MNGAPLLFNADAAAVGLGLLIVCLLLTPLLLPFLLPMPGRRRPRRRPWLLARLDQSASARPVATTTDPLALLGFSDRSGPAVFDVEADPLLPWAGPAPRGLQLTDSELEAIADSVVVTPHPASVRDQSWADLAWPPVGDQAEAWLRENTP